MASRPATFWPPPRVHAGRAGSCTPSGCRLVLTTCAREQKRAAFRARTPLQATSLRADDGARILFWDFRTTDALLSIRGRNSKLSISARMTRS